MKVLLDDRVWQPRHTDQLLGIVRACRSDVAEEVEKRVAEDYAAHRREQVALRKARLEELHDVEKFREAMQETHAKVAALLEVLVDLPIAKAMVKDPETGEITLDPTLINDKDAKVALSAAEKILKVTGALTPPKIDVEVTGGGTFELLDVVEAEVEEAS
jgi:hypothetical protein